MSNKNQLFSQLQFAQTSFSDFLSIKLTMTKLFM